MRTRLFFLALLWVVCCKPVFSQVPPENPNPGNTFPTIVPPSPELSSLANIGTLSAQNQTGAANVQIPLYDLKVGSLDIPISISYSTNGIKVNDVPSRVGLGWNLIAGGSITRIIHDEDDFYVGTHYLPRPTSFTPSVGGVDLRTYLWEALEPANYNDTEKDEYSFNVNGMSGKFFLDDDGLAHLENQSDIKIQGGSDGFILITGLGVKYYFGIALEQTKDVKLNGTNKIPPVSTTGWFLWKIVSPEGDIALFNYSHVDVNYFLGHSQTVMLRKTLPAYSAYPGTTCNACAYGALYPLSSNTIDYDTYFLTSITGTTNGTSINFVYQSRLDKSLDVRLTGITVNSTTETVTSAIKKYTFEYNNYPITSDNQLRYYLGKLFSYSCSDPTAPPLVHQFVYNDPAGLPSERSLSQDYFGYANSANNGTQYFFPKPLDYESYTDGSLGADRTPNFTMTKKGALTKVIYPTGGYKEFVYEPHTLVQPKTDYTYTNSFLACAGTGLDIAHTTTLSFHVGTTSHSLKISCITHPNPGGPIFGQTNYWEAGDGKIITVIKITNVATSQQIYFTNYTKDNMNPVAVVTGVEYNTDYILELTVKGSTYRADAQLTYNRIQTTVPINVSGCGIRVKQINSYDPVANKTTSKYFTYASLTAVAGALGKNIIGDNQDTPDPASSILSSGRGSLTASNESVYAHGQICLFASGFNIFQIPEICDNFIQVSSSSIAGSYSFGGSPIAYTNIIESDDPNFIHGGTEHFYYTAYEPTNVLPVLNTPIESNMGFGNEMNGKELRTRVFKTADDFIILNEQENIYGSDTRTNLTFLNYAVRKRFGEPVGAPLSITSMSYADQLSMYDVGEYAMMSGWQHLDSKITKTYNENGLNPLQQEEDYQYDDLVSKQPTQIVTKNSKGETVKQNFKYPASYTNIAPYPDMVTANIITPVIEQTNTINADPISITKTDYTFTPATGLYKPFTVSVEKGSNPLEIALQYNQYDANGNPVDLITQAGVNRLYFWNYMHSFPVAEINNAPLANVAYTSFEGDDNGGWSFNRSLIIADGITGDKAFTGSVYKENLGAVKSYILTLWAKGAVTANSSPGTYIKTDRSWKLYQWELKDINTLTVVGDRIDEVRLIPVGATITTYTYKPFVGVSTICDNNNNISYFEYDGFSRLILVRDIDYNILKQYEYKYNQVIQPCASTAADWQPTGNTRCISSGPNNDYLTHDAEQEYQDRNNCSPTYLNTRWDYAGFSPDCGSLNCLGADKWVVNGECETATKTLLSSTCASPGNCTCTYRYEWSDGHHVNVDVPTTAPCIDIIPID